MRWQGLIFAVLCVLCLLCLPLALWLGAMAASAHSQGGLLKALSFAFSLLPVLFLLCPIAAWIARSKGHRGASWGIVLFPLVFVAAGFAVLTLVRPV